MTLNATGPSIAAILSPSQPPSHSLSGCPLPTLTSPTPLKGGGCEGEGGAGVSGLRRRSRAASMVAGNTFLD